MREILITGGTGFIGAHLGLHLSGQQDCNVTVCDNSFRGRNQTILDGIKVINCDLTNPKELEKLGKYDYVYHLACINGTKNFYNIPYEVLRDNTLININLIEWCKETNPRKVLYASSSEVYASTKYMTVPTPEDISVSIEDIHNPRWSYAGSKIMGELMFANSGLNYTIVRPHNIYGPFMGYDHVIPEVIKRIIGKESPFKAYGLEQTRAFCYIDDCVKMIEAVMNSDAANGRVINVGGPNEIKIHDLLMEIFKKMNYNTDIVDAGNHKGSVNRRCPDTSLLQSIYPDTSFTNISDGLDAVISWCVSDLK